MALLKAFLRVHGGEQMSRLALLEILLKALERTRLERGRSKGGEVFCLSLILLGPLDFVPFVNGHARWDVANVYVSVIILLRTEVVSIRTFQ
jgi:hypothetical protein